MPNPTLKEHLKTTDKDIAKILHDFALHSLHMQDSFPKYLKGMENSPNKYGEAVSKLDAWANKSLIDCLKKTNLIKKVYSEELIRPITCNKDAKYIATLDPLDGSSNITTNNIFGIILGIYKQDLPQPGKNLVAAAIKVYGPINTLIYTTGNGTHEFVKHYDKDDKPQFFLLHKDLKFPKKTQVFGIGGHPMQWDKNFLNFAKDLFKKHNLKARYCGSFVGDFSQILHKGGFFAYPKTKSNKKGKLRLTYEANPISFLAQQAGGASTDGKIDSILNIIPKNADQTIPVYIGNKELIKKLKEALN